VQGGTPAIEQAWERLRNAIPSLRTSVDTSEDEFVPAEPTDLVRLDEDWRRLATSYRDGYQKTLALMREQHSKALDALNEKYNICYVSGC